MPGGCAPNSQRLVSRLVNIISNKNVPRLDFYWIYPCKKGVTSSRHAPLLFLTLKSWGKRQADGSFKLCIAPSSASLASRVFVQFKINQHTPRLPCHRLKRFKMRVHWETLGHSWTTSGSLTQRLLLSEWETTSVTSRALEHTTWHLMSRAGWTQVRACSKLSEQWLSAAW